MIYINSDGGARGNPGPGAIGIVVRRDNEILQKHSEFIGKRVTNNIAEYEALIRSLELANKFSDEIVCFLDSELVVKQLLGKYKVKNPQLMELFLKVQKLQEKFKKITYNHISREEYYQKIADELVNQELNKLGYTRYKNYKE